jgi:uncharacterized protein (TIGR04255 family)
MANGVFTLNLDERFPRLSKPPIVEAVVHWQARPTRKLNPETLQSEVSRLYPGFPSIAPMQTMELSAKISLGGDTTTAQHKRFLGFRLQAESDREVVQIFRDGVAFSVVKDYSHWDSFCSAAKDAWAGYVDLTAPNEIQRLGVRFINHFPTVTSTTVGMVLREPPTCPANLPLKEFVYQSSFDIPGYDYSVRVIKVLQPTSPGLPQSSGLFLDLEVYSTKPIQNNPTDIEAALKHLRWLKNKVFFSLLTHSTIGTLT